MTFSRREALGAAGGALLAAPAIAAKAGRAPVSAILLRTASPAVRRAVVDLASDLRKVFGITPAIVAAADARADGLVIEVATTGGPRESFSIARSGSTISLGGADMRGTIYAVYQFARDHLGVDPMYFWTDNEPAPRDRLDMPDGYRKTFDGPVIEHRGFFINDEDQLTGWKPASPDQRTNIDPAVMDKVYETILRLKGNMVVPSTWPFPDDPQIKAASARGLIVNQHHATPVGMNAVRWPPDTPYNFSTHPEILRRAWRNAVDLYDRDQEILWTVGMRGLSDIPYDSMDPSVVGNPARMGMLVGQAIREQMAIVRARFPDAKFVTNLWSEGAALVRDGHLTIPPDVITAWPDQGWGIIQDKGAVRAGQGFYYHVAMLNGRANQLSELVPVDRIQSEFGRFIRAGATRFGLVNVSDLRAVAMTANATMEIAWGGVPAGGAPAYYAGWATAQFGPAAAKPMAAFYRDYFAGLPRLPEDVETGAGMEYGDQRYQDRGRTILLRTMTGPPYWNRVGQAPPWVAPRVVDLDEPDPRRHLLAMAAYEVGTCGAAGPRFARMQADAEATLAIVRADRRPYFRYAVLTMLAFQRCGAAMLLAIARSAQASVAGDTASATRHADEALAALAEIKRYEGYGIYGRWSDWWRGEWLTEVDATIDRLALFKRWLADPIGTVPLPMFETDWRGYKRILGYEGGRYVDVH